MVLPWIKPGRRSSPAPPLRRHPALSFPFLFAARLEGSSMLDILRRIVQDINATRDLNEALNLIVAEVKAAIHTDVCSVYMTDATRGEHVLMATDGLRPGAVGKVRLKLGQGLTGLAASRVEPVNVDNAPAHPAFRYIAATGEAPFHGFIGVPIIAPPQGVGGAGGAAARAAQIHRRRRIVSGDAGGATGRLHQPGRDSAGAGTAR
jgi:putative methionine-R-sulfoxide reductase with GAF domain